MRDAERALASWRGELARAGLSGAQLDELEDHVRNALDHHHHAGLSEEAALRASLDDLGSVAFVVAEYRKLNPTMNPLSKLLGTLLSLAVILAAVGANHSLLTFIDPPAMVLVTGLVLGGLVASFGPVRLLHTLLVGLGRRSVTDEREREELISIVRRAYRLSWAGGALGALTGVILMLINLSDPALLGPGAALCLLSLLYGALLAEIVFGNLQSWVAVRRVTVST